MLWRTTNSSGTCTCVGREEGGGTSTCYRTRSRIFVTTTIDSKLFTSQHHYVVIMMMILKKFKTIVVMTTSIWLLLLLLLSNDVVDAMLQQQRHLQQQQRLLWRNNQQLHYQQHDHHHPYHPGIGITTPTIKYFASATTARTHAGIKTMFLLYDSLGDNNNHHHHHHNNEHDDPKSKIQYRLASSQKEVNEIRCILVQQFMNPLSIEIQNLFVAYEEEKLIGFGQIRSLESSSSETSTAITTINTKSDSISYSELASLYVVPSYRGKGIGSTLIQLLLDRYYDKKNKEQQQQKPLTGTEQQQQQQHRICLLTLRPTVPLYEKFGFQVIRPKPLVQIPITTTTTTTTTPTTTTTTTATFDSVSSSSSLPEFHTLPSTIQLEYYIGSILSFLLQNELVCMIK